MVVKHKRSRPVRAAMPSASSRFHMSAETVATAIGIPISKWEGNCHGIALAMLEASLVPDGKLQYGIWWGDIAPGSVFEDRPFTHHGWIKRADGTIVDPTRWVFEGTEPYVWAGKNSGEYDFGANKLKAQLMSPPPAYTPGRDISLVLCVDTWGFIRGFFNNTDDRLSLSQAFWLANLPLGTLDDAMTRELYEALVRADMGALIPIDNRTEVLGTSSLSD